MNRLILKKTYIICISIVLLFYLILLIPDPLKTPRQLSSSTPFIWDNDKYWLDLEDNFIKVKNYSDQKLNREINNKFADLNKITGELSIKKVGPGDKIWVKLENTIFESAPLVARYPDRIMSYIQLFNKIRKQIKLQSAYWDMNSPIVRQRLYRILYGGRIAVEEVLLQNRQLKIPDLIISHQESSQTPSAEVFGLRIHSGDILLSRGGAATSALIARGNDFPANFSHAALVYIDKPTRKISIVEAHIEQGLTVSSLEQYLADKKLRIMVLRLRSNHPGLLKDPLLPHKAAGYILARARREHVVYDFEMNINDPEKLFCSEVVSSAYKKYHVNLWMGLSNLSRKGLINWLRSFDVRYFITQAPSDLEYDPQLCVIAEWRDTDILFKDHVDNAVLDALLDQADKGELIKYNWYLLPLIRMIKVYSVILNWFNAVGPVPEGMNATSALRNKWFSRQHAQLTAAVLTKVNAFKQKQGYIPPYWKLVQFSHQALKGN